MLFDLRDPIATEVILLYRQRIREQGLTVGLTSGSFDLIHFHHFLYFINCRRFCDILFVGVDSDELVRERKGEGRPLIYDYRRVVMVEALKPVTFAFIMNTIEDFELAGRVVRPDVIFKNDVFLGHEKDIVGWGNARQIKIIRDVAEHSSTTDILKEAAKLAGR